MKVSSVSNSGFNSVDQTRRQGGAFTLVEMIIVIGIIALLMSILLPALGQSRRFARQMVCTSNLRQWSLAFNMYTFENNDYYPHTDGLDRQGGGAPRSLADQADYFGWVDVLPPMIGMPSWRDYEPGQHPTDDTIFQCPAAELAPLESYGYRPLRDGYFSYAMNSCLELDENCWHHPDDASWPMPSFLNSSYVTKPEQTVLLFDQLLNPELGYGGKFRNRSAGQYCGSYPKAFSARHARLNGVLGGSLLFCDGHIEWRDTIWKNHWPKNLEVPPRDDLDWYPYPPKTTNKKPDNIIIIR